MLLVFSIVAMLQSPTSLWVTAQRDRWKEQDRARISQERLQFKPGRRDASFASRGAAWAATCERELWLPV